MRRIILMLTMFCSWALSSTLWADCDVTASTTDMGFTTSWDIREASVTSAAQGGMRCGGNLGFGSLRWVFARADMAGPFDLVNQAYPNEKISFNVFMDSGFTQPLTTEIKEFTEFSIIDLGGAGQAIPVYLRTVPGVNVRAGRYVSTIPIRWYWQVCQGLGVGSTCLGWDTSPGLVMECAILGICNKPNNLGSGVVSNILVDLSVSRDCKLDAPNIDFGSAPLVGEFDPIQQRIEVQCAKGEAYSVGLSDGNHPVDGVRSMQKTDGTQAIKYEIYKGNGATGERWGNTGSERFDSAEASVNPGDADGVNAQAYIYTAKVLENQSTPSGGIYQDNVVVDVAY
ncbi:Csu type fimbrial protein [Halomonas caseinilytica]|uniref:Csu type fimbrial protein n=1 Tax=Halomonas caseinilytica TaxID=438744 RepID=UPI000849350D|nr:spore coat U domain-containing protein [Halomonas caseinilytica]